MPIQGLNVEKSRLLAVMMWVKNLDFNTAV